MHTDELEHRNNGPISRNCVSEPDKLPSERVGRSCRAANFYGPMREIEAACSRTTRSDENIRFSGNHKHANCAVTRKETVRQVWAISHKPSRDNGENCSISAVCRPYHGSGCARALWEMPSVSVLAEAAGANSKTETKQMRKMCVCLKSPNK